MPFDILRKKYINCRHLYLSISAKTDIVACRDDGFGRQHFGQISMVVREAALPKKANHRRAASVGYEVISRRAPKLTWIHQKASLHKARLTRRPSRSRGVSLRARRELQSGSGDDKEGLGAAGG